MALNDCEPFHPVQHFLLANKQNRKKVGESNLCSFLLLNLHQIVMEATSLELSIDVNIIPYSSQPDRNDITNYL